MSLFKSLFRKSSPSPPPSLEQEIADSIKGFAEKLRQAGLDPKRPVASAEAYIESQREGDASNPPAALASDLSAFLGGHARSLVGGKWGEDPLYGLSLLQPGNIPHAVLGPYQLVRKKWQLGPGLSLANFFENLPARVASEAQRPTTAFTRPADASGAEKDLAKSAADEARAMLARDLGADVPATLVGLRTAERWLRGHFILRSAPIDDFHRVGFLVGEVMRGLYGGEWNFDQARKANDWAEAALVTPELPFLPVGRILKLLVEQPEGNGLDDYVRLVPAARRDMRRKDE